VDKLRQALKNTDTKWTLVGYDRVLNYFLIKL
jgi:hypothetical protein